MDAMIAFSIKHCVIQLPLHASTENDQHINFQHRLHKFGVLGNAICYIHHFHMNLFKSKYFFTAQVASYNIDYTWGSGFSLKTKNKGHFSILI